MQEASAYPYGAAQVGARLKSVPADFEVEEELGFEPDGAGEHLFLWVEKSGLGTVELIERLARDFDLKPAAISHSGLKDKHALTRQWLSLHLPGQADPFELPEGDGYRVLRQLRHTRKLRPGTHRHNRFRLCLREVGELPRATRDQIDAVAAQGFANYFGQQRFGRNADNVEQALSRLGRKRVSRQQRSIGLSALRSHLFNEVLQRRIELDHWREPLDGDVFMLRGSHSIFSEPLDAALIARFHRHDVSSCGSLYGTGRQLMSGEPLAIEQGVFARRADIVECLERHGSRLQMRPLRAFAEDFTYDYDTPKRRLVMAFKLETGVYATTLLQHFLVLDDASRS